MKLSAVLALTLSTLAFSQAAVAQPLIPDAGIPVQYKPPLGVVSPYHLTDIAEPPAKAAVNGRYELSAGVIGLPVTGAAGRGTVSVGTSGDGFGGQIDLGLQADPDSIVYGFTAHAFNRDVDAYTGGLAAGVVRTDAGATLYAIGPELIAYVDRLTLDVWAGYGAIDFDSEALADEGTVFALGEISYYVTDDFKVSVGGSHMFGNGALQLKTEYRFAETPLSLNASFRHDDAGESRVMVGITGYIGGSKQDTLMERQRRDIGPSRVFDLVTAAGGDLVR